MNHSFASDNSSGIHPRVLDALTRANTGHAVSYGDDPWTAHAHELLRAMFGQEVEVFFAFTGTAANVLALSAIAPSYGAVICTDCAHIATDECGAPERILGCKLLAVPHVNGKIDSTAITSRLGDLGVQHHNQPRAVSVTQPTELGTLYSIDELKSIVEAAHNAGLLVHMDGARLSNACASLGVEPAAMTSDLGVDVLSFGLTKNGAVDAEAVIVFDPQRAVDLSYQRKQQMQLASKMRFLSAQFVAMLENDLWRANATHSNAMAARLAEGIRDLESVRAVYPVQANAVFAEIPSLSLDALREEQHFYVWDPSGPVVRWMASFDTSVEVVDSFIDAIHREVKK